MKILIVMMTAMLMVQSVGAYALWNVGEPGKRLITKNYTFVSDDIDFSFIGNSGNSSVQTLGLRNTYKATYNKIDLSSKFTAFHSKSDGVITAEKYQASIRAEAQFINIEFINKFTEVEWMKNKFAGIENRNSFGTGFSFNLIESKRNKLTSDAGFTYYYENRTKDEIKQVPGATLASKYTLKLTESVFISQAVSGLFDLVDRDNTEYKADTMLRIDLTKRLAVKVLYGIVYQETPVEGFEQSDHRFDIALTVKFR